MQSGTHEGQVWGRRELAECGMWLYPSVKYSCLQDSPLPLWMAFLSLQDWLCLSGM